MKHPLAGPPDVIRWVARSHDHSDCAVVALAMACGVTYERALAACLRVMPTLLAHGMTWTNMRAAVRLLQHIPITVRYDSIDFNDGTGILYVSTERPNDDSDHVVYMWHGHVIEPKFDRQELWEDVSQFCSHYHYKVHKLLAVKPKGEE